MGPAERWFPLPNLGEGERIATRTQIAHRIDSMLATIERTYVIW